MSKKLSIEWSDIQNIIESDWDDKVIKIKLGEFVTQKIVEQNKKLGALLYIKFVKEPEGNLSITKSYRSRCCRGYE